MTTRISRRNVLPRAKAEAILMPYAEHMRDWLHEAWDWLQATFDRNPDLRRACDLSIQAAMLYRRFVMRLESGLQGDPNVQFERKGRMLMCIIDHTIRLRFKKFNKDLYSRNVRTKHQLGLYWQLMLPGMDDRLTDVTFGYCTNSAATELRGAYFACPIGWTANKWFIPVEDATSGGLNLYDQSIPQPDLPAESLPKYEPKIAPAKKNAT